MNTGLLGQSGASVWLIHQPCLLHILALYTMSPTICFSTFAHKMMCWKLDADGIKWHVNSKKLYWKDKNVWLWRNQCLSPIFPHTVPAPALTCALDLTYVPERKKHTECWCHKCDYMLTWETKGHIIPDCSCEFFIMLAEYINSTCCFSRVNYKIIP